MTRRWHVGNRRIFGILPRTAGRGRRASRGAGARSRFGDGREISFRFGVWELRLEEFSRVISPEDYGSFLASHNIETSLQQGAAEMYELSQLEETPRLGQTTNRSNGFGIKRSHRVLS